MSNAMSEQSRNALLARYLEWRTTQETTEDIIPRRPAGAIIQASEEQLELWLHAQMADRIPIYNESVMVRYTGDLNIFALEQAFNEIIRRHEAWRTAFRWKAEGLFQLIKDEIRIELPLLDLRELPEKRREERAREVATCDAKEPFDLTRPPLLRARLVRITGRDHRLFLVLHHLIFDGYSIAQIFLPELQACYAAFAQDAEPALDPLQFQYADYALWQHRQVNAFESQACLAYWDQQFRGGVPAFELSPDRPRLSPRTFSGGMQNCIVPLKTTQKLKEIVREHGVTFFVTLFAAYAILLYHYTGQCDQVIGSVASTRNRMGTDRLLGLFVRPIALRIAFTPDKQFIDLVLQSRDITIGALSNAISFRTLIRRFANSRKVNTHPLYQASFTLEPAASLLAPGWSFKQMDLDTGICKDDLLLVLEECEERLAGRFVYSRDIFDSSIIAGLSQSLSLLLGAVAANPNRTVAELARVLPPMRPLSAKRKFRRWLRGLVKAKDAALEEDGGRESAT